LILTEARKLPLVARAEWVLGPEPARFVRHIGFVEARRPPRSQVIESVRIPVGVDSRRVRGGSREQQEERLLNSRYDPCRSRRQHVGRIVFRLVPEVQRRSVSADLVVVICFSIHVGAAREREPLIPPRRDVRCVSIAVQVLADQRGVVPDVVKPCCQSGGIVEGFEATMRRAVAKHARRVRVETGHDACPARAARGISNEGVRERHAPTDEPAPNVRHRPQRVPPLVVREDDDDVRSFGYDSAYGLSAHPSEEETRRDGDHGANGKRQRATQ
jgi:hypothetical protein